jgi:hypothetical protein
MHKIINWFLDRPTMRNWDEQGHLTSSGFKWSEPVEFVWMTFGTGAFGLVFYGLMAGTDHRTPPGFVTMLMFGAAVCIAICFFCGSIDRGFSFERDGRIRNAGGFVNWVEMFGGLKTHDQITSIEITKTERGVAVIVLTNSGGTFCWSDGLNEPKARLIAVQLTIALRELRQSMATINAHQLHAVSASPGGWID